MKTRTYVLLTFGVILLLSLGMGMHFLLSEFLSEDTARGLTASLIFLLAYSGSNVMRNHMNKEIEKEEKANKRTA